MAFIDVFKFKVRVIGVWLLIIECIILLLFLDNRIANQEVVNGGIGLMSFWEKQEFFVFRVLLKL